MAWICLWYDDRRGDLTWMAKRSKSASPYSSASRNTNACPAWRRRADGLLRRISALAAVQRASGTGEGRRRGMIPGGVSAWRKSLFARLSKFSGLFQNPENLSIKNERDPSWVPLVTLLLPVSEASPTFWHSGRTPPGDDPRRRPPSLNIQRSCPAGSAPGSAPRTSPWRRPARPSACPRRPARPRRRRRRPCSRRAARSARRPPPGPGP